MKTKKFSNIFENFKNCRLECKKSIFWKIRTLDFDEDNFFPKFFENLKIVT